MSDTPEPANQTPPVEPIVDDTASPPLLSASDLEEESPSAPGASDEEEPAYPAMPTQEELDAASPDVQGMVPLVGLNRDELAALYERRIQQLGADRFIIQIANPGSYENLLWFSLNNYSAESERTQDAIAALDKDVNFNYRLEKDGKPILSNTSFKAQRPAENKIVSGEAGIVAMLGTRKGQIRRVPLYNSGICIDIRTPTDDDLSVLLRRARADLDEYGREFGSHFYSYSDFILKRAFFDFLVSITLGSSLKDWKKPGVLAQRLKLSDYDVILTTVASLMYPEGYPGFRHICTRPADAEHPNGCEHVTTITADLTKLVHTNFTALSVDAVAHMVKTRMTTEPLSNKALEAYQEELGFDGTLVTFEDFQFTMVAPSMADYFLAGELFNNDLINEISANNKKDIYDAIAYREGRLYLPWIKRMTSVDEEGVANIVTEDKLVISFMLDKLASGDPEKTLISDFIKFINKSKLSHVCYKTFACEACGYEPETPSGFLTVDPQHSFFIQSTQKLMRR